MPAPKTNQFWKLGDQPGRPKKFETPAEMWASACEYFNWVDAHPWQKVEAIKSGDSAGKLIKIPTARPYTLSGWCFYIGVSQEWWRKFKSAEHEEFFPVIEQIEQIMYTQKLEGAMVGAFKENIVSRVLGLADKADHTGIVPVTVVFERKGPDYVPPTAEDLKQPNT